MNTPDFRKIKFGESDAGNEAKRFPELLLNGYLDEFGISKEALEGYRFLFLGYKGAGKSALSKHLELSNRENSEVLIKTILLTDFPYKLFNKIAKGQAEAEARYTKAWEWLLLIYVFEAFQEDQSSNTPQLEEWSQTLQFLREARVFPIKQISQLVNTVSKSSFSLKIPYLAEANREYAGPVNGFDIELVIDHLKDLLSQVETKNHSYLIIDGLDGFLSTREVQHKSVMALIKEAKVLNDWLFDNNLPFKIIILCRTDMFDQMSDPNKNKLKRDDAYIINWFNEAEADDYSKSMLVQLANLRTRLVFPEVTDVFDEFFPSQQNDTEIRQFLLEHTRHTPRDFLQLLTFIQKSCDGKTVSRDAIRRGIKQYSLDYFKGEIRDELSGKLSPAEIDQVFALFSSFRSRVFQAYELQEEADKRAKMKDLDLEKILHYLFECSAIGHIKEEGEKPKYYFKYRNPDIQFDPTKKITLHKGLWKALVS